MSVNAQGAQEERRREGEKERKRERGDCHECVESTSLTHIHTLSHTYTHYHTHTHTLTHIHTLSHTYTHSHTHTHTLTHIHTLSHTTHTLTHKHRPERSTTRVGAGGVMSLNTASCIECFFIEIKRLDTTSRVRPCLFVLLFILSLFLVFFLFFRGSVFPKTDLL